MAETAPAERSLRETPGQLLAHVRGNASRGMHAAFLVVALHRSDRIAALAQSQPSRIALARIAQRVESVLRPHDRYAIASHDEIWVLLADVPSIGQAELAGSTLRSRLMQPIEVKPQDEPPLRVLCHPAIGGLWFPAGECPPELDLVAAASEAGARDASSDSQVNVQAAQGGVARVDRTRIETELRAALSGNDLEVHFQPQIDLMQGRCAGAEALVRWPHPDGGMVDPGLIAEIAEQRGMMGNLTQFVLNTVLRHAMSWSSASIAPKVSINLSTVTLSDPTYPAFIRDALDTWGVRPDRLSFEITESLIVRDEASAQRFMRQLRDMGCRIALDDFGIGYTSFDYLRKFPLDELKIDQSFVRSADADRGSRRIVQALIDVAHAFDLRAMAEGVDSEAAVHWLRGARCDGAQGFHFARAMDADGFRDWYIDFNRAQARQAEFETP